MNAKTYRILTTIAAWSFNYYLLFLLYVIFFFRFFFSFKNSPAYIISYSLFTLSQIAFAGLLITAVILKIWSKSHKKINAYFVFSMIFLTLELIGCFFYFILNAMGSFTL